MVESTNDSGGGGEVAFGFTEDGSDSESSGAEVAAVAKVGTAFAALREEVRKAARELEASGTSQSKKLAKCFEGAVADMDAGVEEYTKSKVASATHEEEEGRSEEKKQQLKLAAVNSRLLEKNSALEAAQEKMDKNKEEADEHAKELKELAKSSWLLTLVGVLTCGLW